MHVLVTVFTKKDGICTTSSTEWHICSILPLHLPQHPHKIQTSWLPHWPRSTRISQHILKVSTLTCWGFSHLKSSNPTTRLIELSHRTHPMRRAVVKHIHKIWARTGTSNYRLISLTATAFKVIERVIIEENTSHDNSSLTKHKIGFWVVDHVSLAYSVGWIWSLTQWTQAQTLASIAWT